MRILRKLLRFTFTCLLSLSVVGFGLESLISSARAETMDLVSVSKKIRGQVVQIVVPTPDGTRISLGTGFWLNDQGVIATCWHVVSANPTGRIMVQSAVDPLFDLAKRNNITANWQVFSASVVAKDEPNDLAILKVSVNPFGAQKSVPIQIGNVELVAHFASATLNRDLPEAGARVLMAGFPLGQPYLIVQEGTVAALAYNLPGWGATNKILVSTLSNHGNSGAPIFDMQGKVIAILEGEDRAQGQDQERTGISVAIPAYFVSKLAETIHP